MAFMPGMIVGGHLLIVLVDGIPEGNFNQTCRTSSSETPGTNDFDSCVKDETRAREELAMRWSEFDAADRTRCARITMSNHASSYVELLTCLDMEQRVKTVREHTSQAGIMVLPEPAADREQEKPDLQVHHGRIAGHLAEPVPAAARPPTPLTGLLSALCQSLLGAILPVCWYCTPEAR